MSHYLSYMPPLCRQNSEKLEISAEARDNLLQNVSAMELKMTKSLTVKDKNAAFKKKCRYENTGYCECLEKCKFQHFPHICDQFKKQRKCDGRQSCPSRHPKVCKFWKCDVICDMHDNPKSMELTSVSKKGCEVEETTGEAVEKVVDSQSKNNAYKQPTVQKVIELKSEVAAKNSKEQVEKLMRVAINMHRELAELKSRNSY
jgi:hypothetical protein